jgi:hypothetical protein
MSQFFPAEAENSSEFVLFYEASEIPYGAFCNYYISPITIAGKQYLTVEHYYQSEKYSNAYSEIIRCASTPNKARVLARQEIRGGYAWRAELNEMIRLNQAKGFTLDTMKADWENGVKDSVMYTGLQAKFRQHPHLAKMLLNTKDKIIVENSPRDWYWGCGKDGKGKNMLGIALMKLRKELTQK